MRVICITWGVYSSLGKGIAAASLWRLLKSSGYKVAMIKMDPYLHVDAGTMNPYAHGEVFVTDDGAETDLDLWHYERFLWDELTADHSITSGKIYWEVITKEREGAYLWQNVQVIPHVTNTIKDKIRAVYDRTQADVVIVEIGGTVGDIESPAFYEAMRQMKKDPDVQHICYIHLAPIVYLPQTNEPKTKPLQHSVRDLRQTGIYPDVLLCRTQHPLDDALRNKIAAMCDIDIDSIFEGVQVASIYEVPLHFYDQWLHTLVARKVWLDTSDVDLTDWRWRVENILRPTVPLRIGLVGKYTELSDADLSVMEALKHACAAHAVDLSIEPLHPEYLEQQDDGDAYIRHLAESGALDAIVVPGGFGARGTEGMITAIEAARTYHIPFLGICFGLQLATIAYARHVAQLDGASSSEIDPDSPHPVIALMDEQQHVDALWGSMRLGAYPAHLLAWSRVARLYGAAEITERHRHRFEVNPAYHDCLRDAGLVLSGLSPDGRLVEFIELADHPYFVATQAHPEFRSRLDEPHPLFMWLIEAALERKNTRWSVS